MSYLTWDEIQTGVRALAEAHPGRCRLVELPHPSAEGRPILGLELGEPGEPCGPGPRTAIYVGGLHAREWIPPDALLYLAADLLEARASGVGLTYGSARIEADEVRRIFEAMRLVILPCANPDGRVYSQEVDPDWRKNRGGSAEDVCVGVDINRNFDVAWDFRRTFAPGNVSASDDPCHKYVYVGPAAASEPETRNIVWLLDKYPEAGWFIDVHGAVPAVFYNWGLDEPQSVDPAQNFRNPGFDGLRGVAGDDAYREFIDPADAAELRRLSDLMAAEVAKVRGDSYEVSPSFSLYATSGASDDYAFSRHFADPCLPKVLGFTIECGHDFQPDWTEAEAVIREVSAGLARFAADVRVQAVAGQGEAV
jgi:murein tripeptide amidase MpaA